MAPQQAHFLAGVGRAEITPPLEVGLLTSAPERQWAPFESVRRPLHARAGLIEGGGSRVALVSLDLLGTAGKAFGGMTRLRKRIVAASGRAVEADRLVLASTHTHTAPESLAITNLYRTPAFRQWAERVADRIGAALRDAAVAMRPCRVATAQVQAPGLGIYRRIRTTQGIVLSHPEPPPETVISREGPVDDSVKVLALVADEHVPLALLINAACHPVHEMCLPHVSPDYPGEMCAELESRHPGTAALFFNGCAGNINPPTVSGGADQAREHGRALADAVDGALQRLDPVAGSRLDFGRRQLALPARTVSGRPAARRLRAEIAALRLGDAALVFLPGEPFVEIGLAICGASPFRFTAVVAYAGDSIGYVPNDRAFDEGGYEVGPGPWARVGRGSAGIIQRETAALLAALRDSGPQ